MNSPAFILNAVGVALLCIVPLVLGLVRRQRFLPWLSVLATTGCAWLGFEAGRQNDIPAFGPPEYLGGLFAILFSAPMAIAFGFLIWTRPPVARRSAQRPGSPEGPIK
jgi:hypothetical protein